MGFCNRAGDASPPLAFAPRVRIAAVRGRARPRVCADHAVFELTLQRAAHQRHPCVDAAATLYRRGGILATSRTLAGPPPYDHRYGRRSPLPRAPERWGLHGLPDARVSAASDRKSV